MNKSTRDPNHTRFPFFKFLAWKSSDISSAGVAWIINTYMLIFCTNALGMDSVWAGTMILIANIIDMFTDLIIGYLMDKAPVTKFGKYRPFELGIIGSTIFTILLFACPFNSQTLKVIWIFIVYTILFGVFNTARTGAMYPYMIRSFNNDRSLIGKVLSYGGIVTTMGAAVITMTFPKLISAFGDGTADSLSAEGWRKIILIYMIPLTIISIFRFIFIKEKSDIDAGQQDLKLKLSDVWKMMKANPYVWAYGLMIFAFQVVQNLGANAYYFDYIVGSQDKLGTISLFSYFMMPLLLVLPILLRKLGAAKIIVITSFIAIAGYVVNFFAGASTTMLIIGALLTSLVMLPISYLGGILQMNIFNYTEYKGLPRQEATTNAIASGVFTQLGQGFGPFCVGIILKVSGFISSDGSASVTQPDSAIFTIRLLYSLVPLLLMIVVAVACMFQGKLEKKMPEIETELKARRESVIAEHAENN